MKGIRLSILIFGALACAIPGKRRGMLVLASFVERRGEENGEKVANEYNIALAALPIPLERIDSTSARRISIRSEEEQAKLL